MSELDNIPNARKDFNYYKIPSLVYFDTKIPAEVRLFYGEILSLSIINGFCFIKNKTATQKHNVSIRTITNWVKILKDAGYIHIVTMTGNKRKIYPLILIEHKSEK